jgi:hypothetical protein
MTMSTNNNPLLFLALGVGAFLVMSRRQVVTAGPVNLTTQQQAAATASRNNLLNTGINAAMRLFGQAGSKTGSTAANLLGTVDGRSATQWDVTPYGPAGPTFNNPSAFISGGGDGLVISPVGTSPWDYTQEAWY